MLFLGAHLLGLIRCNIVRFVPKLLMRKPPRVNTGMVT